MTAPEIAFATTGRGGTKQAANLLVEAAARGDLQRSKERRWDVYLLNGNPKPDILPVVERLIAEGALVVVDPDADLSLVVPS